MARGILERRFYAPLKDITLDLLNRGPRLTDDTALDDSQASRATYGLALLSYLRPGTHGSLITAHCSLLTAHCPLLTAH